MVIAIDQDRRLPRIEEFLDQQGNRYGERIYLKTGYPIGHEFRKIAKDLGGDWDLNNEPDFYDVINLPFKNGTLVIARPWINPLYGTLRGSHKVCYDGEVTPDLEDSIKEFLSELHQEERRLCSEWYLNSFPYGDVNALNIALEMLEAA